MRLGRCSPSSDEKCKCRHKCLPLQLTSPKTPARKLWPPIPQRPPHCPFSLLPSSIPPPQWDQQNQQAGVCLWRLCRCLRTELWSNGGGEKPRVAEDERWEGPWDVRRTVGEGRKEHINYLWLTPMANGNYICFNYWWPNRLSLWAFPLGTEQRDRCTLLVLFMYDIEARVQCFTNYI